MNAGPGKVIKAAIGWDTQNKYDQGDRKMKVRLANLGGQRSKCIITAPPDKELSVFVLVLAEEGQAVTQSQDSPNCVIL